MKISARCYGCVYCQMCDKEQELKCANEHYILFTTKEDEMLCDLMCGKADEDDYN